MHVMIEWMRNFSAWFIDRYIILSAYMMMNDYSHDNIIITIK